jgi:exodeoxyribonuclease VII small subunit
MTQKPSKKDQAPNPEATAPEGVELPADMSYEQAAAELDAILEELESGETGIDALALQVARAGALLRFCQDKLRDTELAVHRIIKELDL